MNICSVCGKHYMKHWSGNMLVGYVHYDHTPICKGGYDVSNESVVSGLQSTASEPVLLGQYDPRYSHAPINTIPCCLEHSKGRTKDRCHN